MFICSSSSRWCRELSTCLLSSESSSSRIIFLRFCQCSNLFFQRLEPIVSFFIYKQSPSQHLCHLDSVFFLFVFWVNSSHFHTLWPFFWYISPELLLILDLLRQSTSLSLTFWPPASFVFFTAIVLMRLCWQSSVCAPKKGQLHDLSLALDIRHTLTFHHCV